MVRNIILLVVVVGMLIFLEKWRFFTIIFSGHPNCFFFPANAYILTYILYFMVVSLLYLMVSMYPKFDP